MISIKGKAASVDGGSESGYLKNIQEVDLLEMDSVRSVEEGGDYSRFLS